MNAPASSYKKEDFETDQDVRWCPGCGDFAILSALQSVFADLGVPREKLVIVSGIGCSSRLPYYVNTYGFHGIHGRAPAIATGVKLANPDLEVWIATGDGDALAIGGNHLIHALRRNIGVKILLFNNRVYSLTKGQSSPTSELGQKTKSAPYGSIDPPFNALALALGAGATFVARSIDAFLPHLKSTLRRAAAHKGAAFVEILQNCLVFNDGAFGRLTDKNARGENLLVLEDGQPLVFGRRHDKGLRLNGLDFEAVVMDGGSADHDVLIHDERRSGEGYAYLLARMSDHADLPTPIGVFRDVQRPCYEDSVRAQIREITKEQGAGDLEKLLRAGSSWEVRE
ncbi:MAG: 2-oxoacid:ferredoxin oxidoreductase subunit beta [Vicinamibacteria bacterium]|nr:2-oxoacid:ferredoxin oxidoreductase subunit beta [Vicinamibacteria bacterium]